MTFATQDFHDKIVSVHEESLNDGIQVKITFTNGWCASVVQGPYTYGGPEGHWEMGVFNTEGDLDYNNPVTPGDVAGWLTEEKVVHKLSRLANLTAEQLTQYRRYTEYKQAVRRLDDIKGELQGLYEGITGVVHSDDGLLPLELRVGFDLVDLAFEQIAVENPGIEEDVE